MNFARWRARARPSAPTAPTAPTVLTVAVGGPCPPDTSVGPVVPWWARADRYGPLEPARRAASPGGTHAPMSRPCPGGDRSGMLRRDTADVGPCDPYGPYGPQFGAYPDVFPDASATVGAQEFTVVTVFDEGLGWADRLAVAVAIYAALP